MEVKQILNRGIFMKRHYYLSNDIDDLEVLEGELIRSGFEDEQIHVLSDDVANAEKHHLHSVNSLSRQDIIHSGFIGLFIGIACVFIIFSVSYLFKLHEAATGWVPMIMLSVILLGFCTWEGGLWGIQKTNHIFSRFKNELSKGKHVLFVDADESQESKLEEVIRQHETLELAGEGNATPKWIMSAHHQWHKFTHWAP